MMKSDKAAKPYFVESKPFLMFFGAERGTDGTLLDDFHRRGERPRAQQQGHVVCLDGGHPALICTRRRRFRCGSPAR